MITFRKVLLIIAMAFGTSWLDGRTAFGAFELEVYLVQSGTPTLQSITLHDGSMGTLSNSNTLLTFSSTNYSDAAFQADNFPLSDISVAGYALNVVAASTNPSVGSSSDAQLQLNLNITSGPSFHAGTLEILVTNSAESVHPNIDIGRFSLTAQGASNAANVMSSSVNYDPSGTAFGGFNTTNSNGFNTSTTLNLNLPQLTQETTSQWVALSPATNNFSQTILDSVTFTNSSQNATFSMQQADMTTPEPSTLVLWGLAFMGFVGTGLRRNAGRLSGIAKLCRPRALCQSGILGIAIAFAIAEPDVARADLQLVLDGGFEDGNGGNSSAWVPGGNSNAGPFEYPPYAHSGSWLGYFSPNGINTLQQTLNAPQAGTVTIDYWLNSSYVTAGSFFDVYWNAVLVNPSETPGGGLDNGYNEYQFTEAFTGSGSSTLKFYSSDFGGGVGFLLDDVSASFSSSTPEPASCVFWLGGAVGVGWAAMRRKARSGRLSASEGAADASFLRENA